MLSTNTINMLLSYLWGRDQQANVLYNTIVVEINSTPVQKEDDDERANQTD
jgi:hypothetical protein